MVGQCCKVMHYPACKILGCANQIYMSERHCIQKESISSKAENGSDFGSNQSCYFAARQGMCVCVSSIIFIQLIAGPAGPCQLHVFFLPLFLFSFSLSPSSGPRPGGWPPIWRGSPAYRCTLKNTTENEKQDTQKDKLHPPLLSLAAAPSSGPSL